MKNPMLGVIINLNDLPGVQKLHLERINPWILIIIGAVLIGTLALTLFLGGVSQQDNEVVLDQARQTMGRVGDMVQDYRQVMGDQQVQELAVMAAGNPEQFDNLKQYLQGRIPEFIDARLYGPELGNLRAKELGPFGYAILDMLMETESDLAPLQIHGVGPDAYLAMAVRIREADAATGYLLVRVNPSAFVSTFNTSQSTPNSFVLDQNNGRFAPTIISARAVPLSETEHFVWLRVPASLLRIGVVQEVTASSSMGILRPILLFLGILLLVVGAELGIRPIQSLELEEDPQLVEDMDGDGDDDTDLEDQELLENLPQDGLDTDDGLGTIELPDLGFILEKPNPPPQRSLPAVELVESIFRAYDIRGIVGETLNASVARQIGQVVGTLTLEQQAGPVVVARDGRDSGPELVGGLIEGIASTGCDVVDIGAVPTGVLYFSAYELGSGTGVMVTGSHNPPNYNGFKAVIGGVTQAGDQITNMYQRIQDGDLRTGEGKVTTEQMLDQYRERVSGDIQLQRPLKVIADCGNGIGGVCAADVLRDIGAEVISLYDEVDGTFPNHHPDPSEPENLKDLIESVELMNADLGVAFDGDADRLGVVTPSGEIIYSDRLMMLFVKDILSRVPGSTIIYDVKCTGHLQHVIEDAGGYPVMYKTGHSLIKNKMRELDAPFAGEMSGHFFFKERWYGFDCGIYSAARLLEILAADEKGVEEVLGGLPNSVSTHALILSDR